MTPFDQRRPRLPDFESPQRPQFDWMPPPTPPQVPEQPDFTGAGSFLGNVVRNQIGSRPPMPEVRMPSPQIDVPEPALPEPRVNLSNRTRRVYPPVS